jgi:excisionase family DNA binding protein
MRKIHLDLSDRLCYNKGMEIQTMSIREAAEYLGIGYVALYEMATSDSTRLRFVRCGKQIRLLKEDVDNYQPRAYPRKSDALEEVTK